MTATVTSFETEVAFNPIDDVERIAANREWMFERRSDQEVAVEVPGQWCDFGLYFAWSEDLSALHFSAAFDMRVPPARRPAVYELLAHLNERLWMGHFAVWVEEGVPMFRHTLVGGASDGLPIEDVVEVALNECERFYPAFQFVIWGGKSASEAIEASMLDTVGEA